jgi:hypothetical protein
MYTVQDPPGPPSEVVLLPPLTECLFEVNVRIQETSQPGILDRLCHRLNTPCLVR